MFPALLLRLFCDLSQFTWAHCANVSYAKFFVPTPFAHSLLHQTVRGELGDGMQCFDVASNGVQTVVWEVVPSLSVRAIVLARGGP